MNQNGLKHQTSQRLQLFEDGQPDCTLLALHPPDDPKQVVALYLHGKWWSVYDVLRTSSKSRIGLVLVESAVERVVLFLLSQVVEKLPEDEEETRFIPHPRTEHAKLLWRDGEAVGFYTVKHKGSLCDSWTGQSYLLPVLDTVLVRRCWRRRGLGLQMLGNFCSSFPGEEVLGVSSPLSPSMVAVCRRFLQQHGEQREHLYEVEAPGGWAQRRNIWLNIQLGHYSRSKGVNEKSRPTSRETVRSEGDDSSHRSHDAGLDVTSLENICGFHSQQPRLTASSDQHIKPCDTSYRGGSPSSKSTRAGSSQAAHTEHPVIEPPPGRPNSPNRVQAARMLSGPLKSKDMESSGPTELKTTESSDPTEPKTTESSGPTEPKTTESSGPTEPKTTESSDPTEPKTTESSDPTEPKTTESSGPTEPKTTEYSGPTELKTTESSDPTEPKTTESSDPTEPKTTESSDPTEPKTTESSGPTEPKTTESSGPTEPKTTESSDHIRLRQQTEEMFKSAKRVRRTLN
ncbi:protein FAM169B isoform 2-T2 [Polymixia lowei]